VGRSKTYGREGANSRYYSADWRCTPSMQSMLELGACSLREIIHPLGGSRTFRRGANSRY